MKSRAPIAPAPPATTAAADPKACAGVGRELEMVDTGEDDAGAAIPVSIS